MKKIIVVLISVSFLVSCSKKSQTAFSLTTDKRIKTEYHDDGLKEWTVNYHYEGNKLVLIENLRSLGRDKIITYQNDRVKEIKTYTRHDNELVFKDEFIYDDEGKLEKVNNYSKNGGSDLPLMYEYLFKYNNNGLVEELKKKNVLYNTSNTKTKITWENGNAIEVNIFDGIKRRVDYYYTYDDKINYKKDLPIHFQNPIFHSTNNIIHTRARDYSGLIDWECMPCDMKHEYNNDNLFSSEENLSIGYSIDFEYE